MALRLDQKKALVAQVNEVAGTALSAVAAEYSGLTVEQMTQLRAKAHETGVFVKVVKNTLARRALAGTEFECMSESLTGPLVLAFSIEDPGSAARLVRDFAKENDKLVVRFAAVGGELLEANQLPKLANLPTRDQALAMLMRTMKAPVEKLARTLAEPPAKLARALAAVRDQ